MKPKKKTLRVTGFQRYPWKAVRAPHLWTVIAIQGDVEVYEIAALIDKRDALHIAKMHNDWLAERTSK